MEWLTFLRILKHKHKYRRFSFPLPHYVFDEYILTR